MSASTNGSMKVVMARAGELLIETVDEPSPGEGHVLARPIATGICGSDLHTLHAQHAAPDAVAPMVMGHEFCAEILDHGPATSTRLKAGTLVCSVPFIDGPIGPELVGITPNYPGGFAERMLLQERRLLPIPNGLDPASAAVTEPLAVGVHAVAAARLRDDDTALVLGCGPVGLAVIASLRAAGHRPIVAADFSAARRSLAELTGADIVLDPGASDPYVTWLEMAGSGLPPSPLITDPAAQANTVVFDCVGAPGLLERIIASVPSHTRIVVVGVCAVPDTFVPVRATEKELSIQYVFAYRPEEFAHALHLIGEGVVDVGSWITATCSLDGVAQAFVDLESPDTHCKIIVSPTFTPTALIAPTNTPRSEASS